MRTPSTRVPHELRSAHRSNLRKMTIIRRRQMPDTMLSQDSTRSSPTTNSVFSSSAST
jgi:hypothetical protein